jgi:alpha-galactosidase
MMAWVTDSPSWANQRNTSLEYRFLSSMQGSLGIGADLTRWNEQDFQTAQRLVSEYKSIRMTVQQGLLYRLISPRDGSPYSVTQSVSPDGRQAVLFAFLHSSSMGYPYPRIHLKGLDPQARYRLRVLAGKPEAGTPAEASGTHWMSEGIEPLLKGDFQAAAMVLDRQPPR